VDPDLPLIEALQAGDDSALNELIYRHREPLFRFVFRYLRDETTARDVVQETFVRAYFKAESFKPRAAVKTWLYTIALNLSRDQGRRLAKRRQEIPLNVSPGGDLPGLEIADLTAGPDELLVGKDRFALLQRAIDGLPSALREALVLFCLDGKSQKEAAEILGTTPKTVELRVDRAKARMREWLDAFLKSKR
jgi:RNA polymerase sigma factor (sigma-70 family)